MVQVAIREEFRLAATFSAFRQWDRLAPALRSELNVVIPAHISGTASSAGNSSGTTATA
jgi:hypothetical protein